MTEILDPKPSPLAIKAAWLVARVFWPQRVTLAKPCKVCGQHKRGYRVVETSVAVDEPSNGFREAIEAALLVMQRERNGEKPSPTPEILPPDATRPEMDPHASQG